MLPGELILIPADGSSKTYLTPWMSRQADNARITYEIITKKGNPTFAVEVLHKNSDSRSRDGSSVSASFTSTAVGDTTFYTATISALKEMIRFRIAITGSESGGETEWVVFRFHEPTWFDTAAA